MKEYNTKDVTMTLTTYKHEPHCLTLLPKPVSEISADTMEGVLEKDLAVKTKTGDFGVRVTFPNGLVYNKRLYSYMYRIDLAELPCTCTPDELINNMLGFGSDEPMSIKRNKV